MSVSVVRVATRPLLVAVLLLAACGDSASPAKTPSDLDPSTGKDDGSDDGSNDGNDDTPPARSDGGSKPSPSKSDAATSGKTDAGVKSDAATPPDDTDNPGDDAGPGPGPVSSGESSCLDGITDYEAAGPFKFAAKTAGSVKFWVPTVPAGCKVPVVHLANGTGATCSAYQGALERLASHGFLTCCYEDTNTGAGTQGIMAFDAAFSMFPDLAAKKLGSTGHSQGGQAAFTVLQLAEAKYGSDYIYAGLAMEPASGFGTQPAGGTWQQVYAMIKSPMFMFSGTADTLVSESWVQQAYDAMPKSNEVYWWSAVGATHIPTPVGPEQQVSIPWFRWKLLGDAQACAFFKAMPDGADWDERKSENAAACN